MCFRDIRVDVVAEGLVVPYPLILHRLHPAIRRKSKAEITKGACGKPGVYFRDTLRYRAANEDEVCPGLFPEQPRPPGIPENSPNLPKNDIEVFAVGQKNIVAVVERNPIVEIHLEHCLEVPG